MSQGMLCSGDELGLSDDADGILILEPDTRIGLDLATLAGDIVLDVDVKPNRGDALSILGLAREVAAATRAPLTLPELTVVETGDAAAAHVRVHVEDARLCSRFVARYMDGVTVGPSPWEVQRRLIAAGQRPVSNVVDASNYVMLELGKPVHTFDAVGGQRRRDRRPPRTARGAPRDPRPRHARPRRPTRCSSPTSADRSRSRASWAGPRARSRTRPREVVIESAIFDPVSIRRTAFRYALRSEASLRFEKGQDHGLARHGRRPDRRAHQPLGGRAGRGRGRRHEPDAAASPCGSRSGRRAWTGRSASRSRSTSSATCSHASASRPSPRASGDAVPIIVGSAPVALRAEEVGSALVATVPPHRRDLHIEADLVEEIARVRGYETIRGRLPDTLMPALRPEPRRFADEVRALMSGMGLDEVVTHGLVGPEDHERLGLAPDDPAIIRAVNPVTLDHSELRRSLLPGHLRVLVENERQRRTDVAVFEIGPLHRWEDGAPAESEVLGILAGRGGCSPWVSAAADRSVDVAALKGILEGLVLRLGATHLRYEPTVPRDRVDHPGRIAAVHRGDRGRSVGRARARRRAPSRAPRGV